jgi:hypothetical protein
MQASPRMSSAAHPHAAHPYVDRIVGAIGAGRRLLVPDELSWSAPWPHLDAAWTVVPGSESATSGERFLAYANGASIVTVRAVRGDEPDLPGRMVALITLGPRRVTISDCGDDRFDARWTCGDRSFRLTAGRTALGAFMKLLLSIGWR